MQPHQTAHVPGHYAWLWLTIGTLLVQLGASHCLVSLGHARRWPPLTPDVEALMRGPTPNPSSCRMRSVRRSRTWSGVPARPSRSRSGPHCLGGGRRPQPCPDRPRLGRDRGDGAALAPSLARLAGHHPRRSAGRRAADGCPRSGAPTRITAEQVCQLVELACAAPERAGRPISQWTAREIADESRSGGSSRASPTGMRPGCSKGGSPAAPLALLADAVG